MKIAPEKALQHRMQFLSLSKSPTAKLVFLFPRLVPLKKEKILFMPSCWEVSDNIMFSIFYKNDNTWDMTNCDIGITFLFWYFTPCNISLMQNLTKNQYLLYNKEC